MVDEPEGRDPLLPAFWADTRGRVFVQYDGSDETPECCPTRLRLRHPWPRTGPGIRLRVRSRSTFGADPTTFDVEAWKISNDYLVAPTETTRFPSVELSSLSGEGRTILCSALHATADGWPVAFEGSPAEGRALATLLAGVLGLDFVSYVFTERTQLRDLLGDTRNPQTFASSPFHRCLRDGGIFLVDVPELDSRTVRRMTMLAPFRSEVEGIDLISIGLPEEFRIHPDFHLGFNLPAAEISIPIELAANTHFMWTEPGCTSDLARAPRHNDANRPGSPQVFGPHKVLVLMKFGVPAYESWFEAVIRPAVEKYGEIVQLREPQDEWRSEMRFAFERVDAVLVDLSHDMTGSLSPNVIWELTTVYRAVADEGYRREKVLCFARGLEKMRSRDPDASFVYSGDINPGWLPPTVSHRLSRSLNPDDVLGMRIRRYDHRDKADPRAFMAWLEANLAPWVQGVDAPITDEELRSRAVEFARRFYPDWAELERLVDDKRRLTLQINRLDGARLLAVWGAAIAYRDFDACWKLFSKAPDCPKPVAELLGAFLSTISATDVFKHHGYWTMAKDVVHHSLTLRTHLLNVLETPHIHRSHFLTNQWRDHAWRCFAHVPLSRTEIAHLRRLAGLERDADIRLTIDSVMISLLPRDEQARERTRRIRQMYGFEDEAH